MTPKRYIVKSQVTEIFSPHLHEHSRTISSVMEEDSDGAWIRFSDFEKMRLGLEDQIPELKLRKTIAMIVAGICPECGMKIRGYSPPAGSFAPEMYATMRESNINPSTGHKNDCPLAKLLQ